MAERVVTVTLGEAEQIELEEIVIDGDEKAALEFLKRVIYARVKRATEAHCKPPI